MDSVIKRFFIKSLVKLSRKPSTKVSLRRLDGLVVDIGGGGEGVIARACGSGTVCVDVNRIEIGEAKARGALANWIICDACSMPFRNDIFDAATFFFSLMYIRTAVKKHNAIKEAARIIKSGGLLHVWDTTMQEKLGLDVVFVEARLPDGESIYTGYGVKGKEKKQTPDLIRKMTIESGFEVATESCKKGIFQLEMKKRA